MLTELANSFSWSLLLTWYLHSVVFIHVVFVWWCSLLSLSLGHYCWHVICTQLCSSMSCLFDVHCYLFLLVIIVECNLHSVVFIHVVFVWSCWVLTLSLGHYCWHDIYTQLCSFMSCLFDDVHCSLFLLVIIVGSMSVSSCVQPWRTSRRHPVVINGTSSNHAKSSLKCRLKLRRIKWVHLLMLIFTWISVCYTQ